jgi:hypothetical protein
MLDEEILDVVDVARIGVAEVRQIRRALAMLTRGALGRLVRRELLASTSSWSASRRTPATDTCSSSAGTNPSQRIAATAIAVANRPARLGRRRRSSTSPSASVKCTPITSRRDPAKSALTRAAPRR